jgi:hypothetical protein
MRIFSYALLIALVIVTSSLSIPAGAHAWSGLKTDSPTIAQGESVILKWDADTGEAPSLSPQVGAVKSQGELAVKPDKTTTYTLTSITYMFGQPVPTKYEITIFVIPR